MYSLGDIKKDRILLECWSFDTIGNAVATRLMHTDIADLKRLLIITNKFHIERTKSIFTHIFNLPSGKIISTKKNDNNNGFFFFFSAPSSVSQSSMHPTTSKYKLAFMEVNNDGMSSKQIEQRIKNVQSQERSVYITHTHAPSCTFIYIKFFVFVYFFRGLKIKKNTF